MRKGMNAQRVRFSVSLPFLMLIGITGCDDSLGFVTPEPAVIDFRFSCRSLAFSADGSQLAIGGRSYYIKSDQATLLDSESGETLTTIPHLGDSHPTFSSDGKRLLTGGWLGGISIWDAETGDKLLEVEGHVAPIRTARYSPDGRLIASTADDGTVKLWTAETLEPVGNISTESTSAPVLAFSKDSQTLAVGGSDRRVRFWSTSSLQETSAALEFEFPVRSLVFSPNDHYLLTRSADCDAGTLQLWDLSTRSVVKELPTHVVVAFASDFSWFATAMAQNATVFVWDTKTMEERFRIVGFERSHFTTILDPEVILSPNEDRLFIGADNVVAVDVKTGATERLVNLDPNSIRSMALSPDGARLVISPRDGKPFVFDSATGDWLNDLDLTNPQRMIFSPDGERLIATHHDNTKFGSVALLDPLETHKRRELYGPMEAVTSVAFSSDGRLVAAGSLDRSVHIWESATGVSRSVLNGHEANVYQVAFAADEDRLVTASDVIRIWNWPKQEIERTLNELPGPVYSAAFSPNGDSLAAGNADGQLVIWRTTDWSVVQQLQLNWPIRAVEFSPTGNQLAIAGGSTDGGVIEIREMADLSSLQLYLGHRSPVTDVSFISDGIQLVSGGIDKSIHRWELASGQAIEVLPRHELGISSVAAHPSSKILAGGGFNGVVISEWK